MLALMVMGNYASNYASLPFSNSVNRLDCQTACDGNFDLQRFSGVVSNQPEAANGATDKLRPSKRPPLQGQRMAPRVRRNKSTSYD